jgi:hypothetical protein
MYGVMMSVKLYSLGGFSVGITHGLRWCEIHKKFHEIWYRRSSNIKILPTNLEFCNVYSTNGRDL